LMRIVIVLFFMLCLGCGNNHAPTKVNHKNNTDTSQKPGEAVAYSLPAIYSIRLMIFTIKMLLPTVDTPGCSVERLKNQYCFSPKTSTGF
jgi:hypothetical protein